jgi:hypothetical protein
MVANGLTGREVGRIILPMLCNCYRGGSVTQKSAKGRIVLLATIYFYRLLVFMCHTRMKFAWWLNWWKYWTYSDVPIRFTRMAYTCWWVGRGRDDGVWFEMQIDATEMGESKKLGGACRAAFLLPPFLAPSAHSKPGMWSYFVCTYFLQAG